MKNVLLFILFLLITNISYSQQFQSTKERNENKPKLFDKHDTESFVHNNFFNSISSVKLGDKVTIQVSQKYIFKGIVTILHETVDYRTISVDSEELPTLRLIVSRTSEDKYYGIIACLNHKDVLVLKQNETSKKYVWLKKEIADILPD